MLFVRVRLAGTSVAMGIHITDSSCDIITRVITAYIECPSGQLSAVIFSSKHPIDGMYMLEIVIELCFTNYDTIGMEGMPQHIPMEC